MLKKLTTRHTLLGRTEQTEGLLHPLKFPLNNES